MRLTASGLQYDGKIPIDKYSLLLEVTGELQLVASTGATVFREPLFPVVELGVALGRWHDRAGAGSVTDFAFESLESDLGDLLWFRRSCGENWEVGSPLSELGSPTVETLPTILVASASFAQFVSDWVSEHLGISVSDLVDE